MVPPDGARIKRLPTLSWESVVGDDASEAAAPPSADSSPSAAAASPAVPLTPPAPIDDGFAPITLAPLTLSLQDDVPGPAAARRPVEPPPVTAIPPIVAPAPLAPIVVADRSIEPSPPVMSVAPAPVPPSAPVAMSVAAPPLHEASPAPTAEPVPQTPPSLDLPQIVEATPPPVASSLEGLVVEPPPVPPGPSLPSVQQPDRRSVAADPVETFSPAAAGVAAPTQRRRKKRGGLKLVVVFVVLAGLVAAGVVYGRQYLLPSEWDSTAQPYAVAVEDGLGAEFVEPIAVIAEPSEDFTSRLAAELTGDWSAQQPMWRALGLLSGPATPEAVAIVLEGWQDAVYSSEDGQVYHDGGAKPATLDAQIVEAMTAASLDQRFGWSAEQANRTLDDVAQTSAQVLRESRRAQRSSIMASELDPIDPAVTMFLPPVLGYRVLAPAVFAEFEDPSPTGGEPLADIGTGGPGPMPTDEVVLAPDAMMIGDDVVANAPRAMDRSFWYLVFAGFLDPTVARQASDAVVENAVVIADGTARQCVYATFAGGDVAQTSTLRAALDSWSLSVPAEFTSSVSVLADGTLQLVSCDPGMGFEVPSRIGTARELVGWRIAELATIEAVATAGGSDAELAAAWTIVEESNVGAELASLPPDTSPADAADAARNAVASVLAPVG